MEAYVRVEVLLQSFLNSAIDVSAIFHPSKETKVPIA
jgi:hypothetical protein